MRKRSPTWRRFRPRVLLCAGIPALAILLISQLVIGPNTASWLDSRQSHALRQRQCVQLDGETYEVKLYSPKGNFGSGNTWLSRFCYHSGFSSIPFLGREASAFGEDGFSIGVKGREPIFLAMQNPSDVDGLQIMVTSGRERCICVSDSQGGNGFNSESVHIFVPDANHQVRYLGHVTFVEDVDGDGSDDLVTYDDRWELNGYTCHATAPAIPLFWTVRNGRLEREVDSYRTYYHGELAKLERKIQSFPTTRPKDGRDTEELLSAVLEKALIHAQLGSNEEGRRAFRRNIRHFDERYFYCGGTEEVGKVDVSELEEMASGALGNQTNGK